MAVGNTKDVGTRRGESGRAGRALRALAGGSVLAGSLVVGAGALAAPAGAQTSSEPPGVTSNSITVGSISDISAPIAGLFEGAKVGTQAYFAMINSEGGVNGRKLMLNGMDSAFSSGTVGNEAQNIAANDFAIVGGFSLLDGAEQSAIDANKVPMITQTLDPKLDLDPNVYAPIPVVNGGEAVGPFKWLKSKYPQAVKSVGYIGSNSAATAVTAEHTFHNLTNSLGYNWVYDRDASFTETSFLPDMIKMKNSGVKLMMELTQQGAYISTMAQENKQEGLNAVFFTGASAYEAGFNPGSAGNGALLTTVTALYMGRGRRGDPGRVHLRPLGQEGRPADAARPLHAVRLDQRRDVRPGAQGCGRQPDAGKLGRAARQDHVLQRQRPDLDPGPREEDPRAVLDCGGVQQREMASHCARPEGWLRVQSRGLLPEQLQGHLALARPSRPAVALS